MYLMPICTIRPSSADVTWPNVGAPTAQRETRRRVAAAQPRQLVAEAENEAMPHVEEGVALFTRERGVDRRLIADRDRQHGAWFAADVQARDVIDRMAQRVRREHA